MSDKIKRLRKLPGSKTITKQPTQSELGVLVKELQANALAQKESQADIAAAIKQLSAVVMAATKEGFDVSPIIEAIAGLKEKVAQKNAASTPLDYKINFVRDKFGLMKTGIELKAVTPTLN